jgi:hypothetical protein
MQLSVRLSPRGCRPSRGTRRCAFRGRAARARTHAHAALRATRDHAAFSSQVTLDMVVIVSERWVSI